MIFGKHFVMVIADDDHCVRRHPLERFCHCVHGSLDRLVTLLTCLKGDLGSKPCSVLSMQFLVMPHARVNQC